MRDIRAAIAENRFEQFVNEFYALRSQDSKSVKTASD
jgi:queuine/archaeosine tRNA-ribosyltransferase